MSRGKRYNGSEHKLNIKKVIAVIIAFLVIIMFVAVFIKLMQPKAETTEKKVAMAYYSAFTNNKWGIIDSSGNTVITPGYDEMVVVPNKDKAVFIVTYDVDYTNGTYKTKAVNEKNEQLFSTYDQVEAIQNYDQQNNIWYEKSCLRVKKDNKYGIMDKEGKTIIEPNYDNIKIPNPTKAVFFCYQDDEIIAINDKNEKIFTEYENITPLRLKNISSDLMYEKSVLKYKENGKYGGEQFGDPCDV